MQKLLVTTAAVLSLTAVAGQAETIRIGVLATLEGAFTALGEDGVRGVELAVAGMDSMVAGNDIEILVQSTDTTPDSAIRGARRLIAQDGVQMIVGPLSGAVGIAIRDFSREYPDVTFVNGVSGAQDTTLREPSENFFRFNTEGAQWMAGLADYIYNEKGYRSLAVLAEDYSFPYTQVFGLLEPFCRLGGEAAVDDRFWVPIGNGDYSSVIAALPDDVDAIYVALGGSDAVLARKAGSAMRSSARRRRVRSRTPMTVRPGSSSSRPTKSCTLTASPRLRCSPMATTSTPWRF